MMSNFQYRKSILVNQESRVLFHCDRQIFSDVHQAVFASACPSQLPESEKGTELNQSQRTLKREKRRSDWELDV
jgi:hypothetical protein